MSAAPPPYTPQTDFALEAQQPIVSAGLPGAELDQEFVNVQETVNAIRARLAEIQRDDGALANGIVGFAALDPAIAQFAISPSVRLRGFWAPNTPYVFDGTRADVFIHEGTTRITGQTYVSDDDFGALDEAATGVLGTPPDIGTIVRDVFTGDGVETEFTMTQDPVTTTNVHVYVNGLLKTVTLDFTIAGDTITFLSPPANLAVIVTEVGVVSELVITTVGDGTITAAKIAASAVTTAKIAALNVTEAKLAAGAVTNGKIADSAVTAAKIQDGAVTNDKLALGSISGDKIVDDAINGDKIANGSITTAHVGTGQVATGTIADGAITAIKIAANAVATASILDANVTTAKIADNAVTATKIPDASITPAKLSGGQSGSAPIYGARAFVNVDGVTAANKTGTYTQTLTVVTATVTAHGLRVGHVVYADFTSGTATDAEFVVATVVDANNFTFTRSTATTSGNVTFNFVTINAAGNVSSVAKSATGDLTLNFTTALPNTTYTVSGAVIGQDSTHGSGTLTLKPSNVSGNFVGPVHRKTVDAVAVQTALSGSSLSDMKEFSVIVFG